MEYTACQDGKQWGIFAATSRVFVAYGSKSAMVKRADKLNQEETYRKPQFVHIPHLDCRGDYPNYATEAADRAYCFPYHYQPIGLTDSCRDLNDNGNLTRALLHLQKNYEADKRQLRPVTILIYNFGLTLIARQEA